MAEEEKVKVEGKFQDPEGPKNKNPLLTILMIVNAGLLGVIGYFQFVGFNKRAQEPSIKDIVQAEMKANDAGKEESADGMIESGEAKDEDGLLFPVEGFTANLAHGDGPRRFVRLNAVLKFSKDSKETEFKARLPQIRDTIIGLLNSKRPEDLLKLEGKNYLKEEIKSAINTFLIDGKVIDVYYVGFQVN